MKFYLNVSTRRGDEDKAQPGDVICQSNLIHLLKLDINLNNEAIFKIFYSDFVSICRNEQ